MRPSWESIVLFHLVELSSRRSAPLPPWRRSPLRRNLDLSLVGMTSRMRVPSGFTAIIAVLEPNFAISKAFWTSMPWRHAGDLMAGHGGQLASTSPGEHRRCGIDKLARSSSRWARTARLLADPDVLFDGAPELVDGIVVADVLAKSSLSRGGPFLISLSVTVNFASLRPRPCGVVPREGHIDLPVSPCSSRRSALETRIRVPSRMARRWSWPSRLRSFPSWTPRNR